MSDDPDESITSGNFVVASEVMASAIRILALLDLSDREIADLFEAEASEGTATPTVDDDDEDVTDARPWRLDTLAEAESFSNAINRFAKRVSALRTDQEVGPAEVRKLADLCLGVIPAFAGAQRWYREQCAEQGLEFAICRDVWRASASDEMLDHEHEVVFFDHLSISYELKALQTLAEHCERLALAEPVEKILSAIEQEGLQLPPAAKLAPCPGGRCKLRSHARDAGPAPAGFGEAKSGKAVHLIRNI